MEFEDLAKYYSLKGGLLKEGDYNHLITSDIKRITVLNRNMNPDELLLSHVNISKNKKYQIEGYVNEIHNRRITIWIKNDIGEKTILILTNRNFKKLFINISQLRDKKLESIL